MRLIFDFRFWFFDSLINRYITNVMSILTDNDSDDSVNDGSPKMPPNRQHRKEKKEFPVSLEILHIILRCNIYLNCDQTHFSLLVSCGFIYIFGYYIV